MGNLPGDGLSVIIGSFGVQSTVPVPTQDVVGCGAGAVPGGAIGLGVASAGDALGLGSSGAVLVSFTMRTS